MAEHAHQHHVSPGLVGVSVGLGVGFATAVSKEMDSLLLASVVSAAVAGTSAWVIYRVGQRFVHPTKLLADPSGKRQLP